MSSSPLGCDLAETANSLASRTPSWTQALNACCPETRPRPTVSPWGRRTISCESRQRVRAADCLQRAGRRRFDSGDLRQTPRPAPASRRPGSGVGLGLGPEARRAPESSSAPGGRPASGLRVAPRAAPTTCPGGPGCASLVGTWVERPTASAKQSALEPAWLRGFRGVSVATGVAGLEPATCGFGDGSPTAWLRGFRSPAAPVLAPTPLPGGRRGAASNIERTLAERGELEAMLKTAGL